jgi:putative SOS response-associated peptidase YedK
MCGRYYRIGDKQAIAEWFHADPAEDLPDFASSYNIAPSSTQPVIRQGRDTGTREMVGMRWGLVGFGSAGPDPKRTTFNARTESLEHSTLWRRPLHRYRCIVPLSGFYEWRKSDRVPFRFALEHQDFYGLAGLWDAWKAPDGWLQSFSVITVTASPVMSAYHDRMPAILHPSDYDAWLDRAEVERAPAHLLRPYDGSDLVVYKANRAVGNVRNDRPNMLNSK